ncbi:hypothetical protein HPB47_009020 [Ixodes persulcatus]|uniref:Uncharacterized protein n=1 Tax=Ixodes persulcatus TaxID=34615 RepID=A0AC60P373_IXOPE|nr:hypothetical protein HPB47_009020 [Ixodes persulcatus]
MSGNNSYDDDADNHFYDDDLDDMDGFYYDNIPAQEDRGIPAAHFQDSGSLHVAQHPGTPNNNTTLTSTGRDMPTKANTSDLELPEKVLSSERALRTESAVPTERSTTGTTTPTVAAVEVLKLTPPPNLNGTINFKAKGHTLPAALTIYCSVGATYAGPFPVGLCDRIILKDAVGFDKKNTRFIVRTYDAFMSLKRLQTKSNFKIMGLLTRRKIEQFRLQESSNDAFVEKVEGLLLRINFDGLCLDLAAVTRLNHLEYRHILKNAAMDLAMEVRGSSKHRSVCWTLAARGMEYRLLVPKEANTVGVLARFVRKPVDSSDVHDLLTDYRPDCAFIADVDLDDVQGLCRGISFPLINTVREVFNKTLRDTQT